MARSHRNYKPLSAAPVRAHIESLTQDARGVARINGKAVFVDGALPGEEVTFAYRTQRKRFDEGEAVEVMSPAPERVVPKCLHFGTCGGCSLQHLSGAAQIAAKQQILLDAFQHIGQVEPGEVLTPLRGPQEWGYRRKARLGVKYVAKKEKLLVGFRERRSALLADLSRCEVLHPSVGGRLEELRGLLAGLESYQKIPQIEVAVGDEATALVFRHLEPLSEGDLNKLRGFGEQYKFQIYLQSGGPESVTLLWPAQVRLSYMLPAYNVELFFLPTDFTQVNAGINRLMIERAVGLLEPQPHERVLDLFCGIGNFTLPLARRAGRVVGVEGDEKLVQRARANAAHNGIDNVEFYAADLAQDIAKAPWATPGFDKILLDPPRTGALEVIKQVAALRAARIVYVSCNPATLARDARELVHVHGYRLARVGVMDMFPHTTHVESIALFEKN